MPETAKSEPHTVFSFPRVALDHLVSSLETGEGHVRDRVLFVMSFGGGNDGGESGEREVDTGERHQVGLEFVQIDIQGTVESERSGDGRNNLGNQTVEVGEAWGSDSQVLLADIVDGLIVDHERTVRVFESGVSGQDGVVWLDNRIAELGGGVNAELELGLLSIISRKTLK